MERRDLGNGAYALVSPALENRGFLAAFTERTGGVSPPPYESLNLGLRTNDAGSHVIRNRRRVIRALDVPPFAAGEQVHGGKLARVGQGGAGFEDVASAVRGVDSLSVSRPGVPLAVFVADCVPIALASPGERLLVVVHAGWRGIAAGILARAVGEFERASGVLSVMGPAIGPCHYEVGDEVVDAVGAGSGGHAVTERRKGRVYLDLPGTAASVLHAGGLRHIETTDLCTACHGDRFFSHRRDGLSGRQALISMMM